AAADATVGLGRRLLHLVWRRAKQPEAVAAAVAELAEAPADPDALAGLRLQVRKVLTQDPQLLAEIAGLLAAGGVVVTASGERSVAIGGDNSGSISTGDGLNSLAVNSNSGEVNFGGKTGKIENKISAGGLFIWLGQLLTAHRAIAIGVLSLGGLLIGVGGYAIYDKPINMQPPNPKPGANSHSAGQSADGIPGSLPGSTSIPSRKVGQVSVSSEPAAYFTETTQGGNKLSGTVHFGQSTQASQEGLVTEAVGNGCGPNTFPGDLSHAVAVPFQITFTLESSLRENIEITTFVKGSMTFDSSVLVIDYSDGAQCTGYSDIKDSVYSGARVKEAGWIIFFGVITPSQPNGDLANISDQQLSLTVNFIDDATESNESIYGPYVCSTESVQIAGPVNAINGCGQYLSPAPSVSPS
ncbi:hypothetical protein KGA66_26855, partial [Actinocrinis puniceicyclus]